MIVVGTKYYSVNVLTISIQNYKINI